MADYNFLVDLDSCSTHEQVVSRLSPVFDAAVGDNVNLELNITNFTYPDFLVLVAAALMKLDEIGIKPTGSVKIDSRTSGYISRMNFFQNLNIPFEEEFIRRPANDRFIEITNFDSKNDYQMVDKVIQMLQKNSTIDSSVMYLISFCLGEVVGNIYFHAESNNGGWIVAQYYPKKSEIRIMVSDTGCGIHESLTKNISYKEWDEVECLKNCIVNRVTNGNGMGFGLYATSNFVKLNNGELIIYSGNSYLKCNKDETVVNTGNKWQGTFVYLNINTKIAVDPAQVTDGYVDYVQDFIERYEEGGIDGLW